MMFAVISILTITGAVWMLNKALSFKVCPVCAGVSGTWLLITLGLLTNILTSDYWLLTTAMLMGGTVVGIAYQGEKILAWPKKWPVLWKLTVITIGFPAAYYSVMYMSWSTLAVELVVLAVLLWLFFIRRGKPEAHIPHRTDPADVQDLEKKLENCC